MSVIIKDAKAPKNCAECWYSKGVYCLYHDMDEWVGEYQIIQTKPSWCPIIEIPDEHGRLVDADELLDMAKRQSGPMTGDGWDNLGIYAMIERVEEWGKNEKSKT